MQPTFQLLVVVAAVPGPAAGAAAAAAAVIRGPSRSRHWFGSCRASTVGPTGHSPAPRPGITTSRVTPIQKARRAVYLTEEI